MSFVRCRSCAWHRSFGLNVNLMKNRWKSDFPASSELRDAKLFFELIDHPDDPNLPFFPEKKSTNIGTFHCRTIPNEKNTDVN